MRKTYFVEIKHIRSGKYSFEHVEKRIIIAESEEDAANSLISRLYLKDGDTYEIIKVEEREKEKPITFDRWNYPERGDYPSDRQLCLVAWTGRDGKEDVFVGGWIEKEKDFWVNWGAGGGAYLGVDPTELRWCDLQDFNM